MRVFSYNIRYGNGRDDRYDLTRIEHAVKSADIAALQKLDRHWSRTDFHDQPPRLAANTLA